VEECIIFILQIIISGLIIFFCWKKYTKEENNIYKLLYFTVGISWLILVIIYDLDRYNIPTRLGWVENTNSQNWLMILGTYIPSIISAIVGAIFLIAVTVKQIEYNRKDNEQRDLENLRIQNMPILKYSFNSENRDANELENLIMTNIEDGIPYNFNIYLKNVGLNTIKNIKIDFKSDLINHSIERILGKETLEVMEKGEEKEINKFFSLKQSDVPYKVIVIVYYEDVLSNWYKQEIQIEYIATSIFEPGGYIGNIKYEVKEAKIWEKK